MRYIIAQDCRLDSSVLPRTHPSNRKTEPGHPAGGVFTDRVASSRPTVFVSSAPARDPRAHQPGEFRRPPGHPSSRSAHSRRIRSHQHANQLSPGRAASRTRALQHPLRIFRRSFQSLTHHRRRRHLLELRNHLHQPRSHLRDVAPRAGIRRHRRGRLRSRRAIDDFRRLSRTRSRSRPIHLRRRHVDRRNCRPSHRWTRRAMARLARRLLRNRDSRSRFSRLQFLESPNLLAVRAPKSFPSRVSSAFPHFSRSSSAAS